MYYEYDTDILTEWLEIEIIKKCYLFGYFDRAVNSQTS